RNKISARLGAGVSRQLLYALSAASTASFTSSGPEAGNSPSTSPVAGLVLQKVRPERAGTGRPSIRFVNFSGMRVSIEGSADRARREEGPPAAPGMIPVRKETIPYASRGREASFALAAVWSNARAVGLGSRRRSPGYRAGVRSALARRSMSILRRLDV